MKVSTGGRIPQAYAAKSLAPGTRTRTVTAGTAPPGGPADVTDVLGIPEAEFTPRVRAAIMTLMAEVDRLRQDLDRAKARIDEVQSQADQDALLPILNRRAFVREMTRMMAFAERYAVPTALIYLDLNGFKAVNDTFGHDAGDAALIHICGLLTGNVRESDILGRLGGDEFAIVLAKADAATALKKVEGLNAQLMGNPFLWNGRRTDLSFAYGVHLLKSGDTASAAIAAADQAMYRAKRARSAAAE
jgi:diguanylate cyclase (GGDEF)-like protein